MVGFFVDLGSSRSKSRVLAIGIAPWGMLKRRQRFEGKVGTTCMWALLETGQMLFTLKMI